MTALQIATIALASTSLGLAVLIAAAHDSAKTVGGLTFWRIGRIGGSFYVARR